MRRAKKELILLTVYHFKKNKQIPAQFFWKKRAPIENIWWTLRLIYTFYTFNFFLFSADSFNVFLRMIVEAYSSVHSSYMLKTDAYLPLWWLVSVCNVVLNKKRVLVSWVWLRNNVYLYVNIVFTLSYKQPLIMFYLKDTQNQNLYCRRK